MAAKIFVNLPVKDLNKSIEFFTKLGYKFNPQFTNENSTSMIISDDIYVMLLTEPFFQQFTKKTIAEAKKTTESIICLSAESREDVDALVKKAVDAGGASSEKQDHGWMYQHGYEDLDGHLWEIAYMDMSKFPQ
ncbi:MAG: VOC family protein [Bacteroidia bacterium]